MTTSKMDVTGQVSAQIVDLRISPRSISIQPTMLIQDMTSQMILIPKFILTRKTKKLPGLETPQRLPSTMVLISSLLKSVQPYSEPTINGTLPNSISTQDQSIPSTIEDMTSRCILSILPRRPSTDSDTLPSVSSSL